jgi:xanthine dehydrogenase YagR molybdenum-binding subunit
MTQKTEETKNIYYMDAEPEPDVPPTGEQVLPWKSTHVVGKPLARVDAFDRLSGTAVYPSDVILPGMLFGALVTSPHANAKVKKIDTSAAEKMPGVRAVISSADRNANPDFSYRGDGDTKLFDTHCRYEGDAVAAVAADSPYQAWDAAMAIAVEYEVLPFVSEPGDALDKKAPKVHDSGNMIKKPEVYSRGDTEQGFAEADVVLEQEYSTACQIHTPVELHGCVASWDGDDLIIWESTQGVYQIQSDVSKILGMPLAKVRVIGHYMGGGFGSKLQAGKYTVAAALLAKKAARPVKLFLTREQTYLAAGNRPPSIMTLKAGVKKDGTLTAFKFTGLGTAGAYPTGGVSLLDFSIKDLYLCPNVECELTDVYVNAGPARPFRAPGHPQAAWALEQMMDALAEKIDMDPVDLRLKNIPKVSQSKPGNPPYTSTGLKECLEKGAEAFGWKEKHAGKGAQSKKPDHIKTGVGMASCIWFIGGGWPPATVIVKLFADGSANLNMGASDIGTGTKTVMAMVVSEELGIKPENIQIEHADTGTTQWASVSGGSKTVPTESPAVRQASIEVKKKLLDSAAKDLETESSDLELKDGVIYSKSDQSKKVAIPEVSALKSNNVLVGIGYKEPNPKDKAINPFGAQFCEVEVNTMTGEAKILSFTAAHDSGRVMNSLTFDSQVGGGITMGIGFGTIEGRILDKTQTGKVCNRNWHDYKLPTSMDVSSDLTSVHIDPHDTEANSTGAKGLGEPVTIPTAPAVANAVYNAAGIRVVSTPMNPPQICRLLSEKQQKKG